MGRSRNTGQLSLVLYEDPPDGVPKIHVRSSKYMAWIAEMMLPTYLHVNKVLNTSTNTVFKLKPQYFIGWASTQL